MRAGAYGIEEDAAADQRAVLQRSAVGKLQVAGAVRVVAKCEDICRAAVGVGPGKDDRGIRILCVVLYQQSVVAGDNSAHAYRRIALKIVVSLQLGVDRQRDVAGEIGLY